MKYVTLQAQICVVEIHHKIFDSKPCTPGTDMKLEFNTICLTTVKHRLIYSIRQCI